MTKFVCYWLAAFAVFACGYATGCIKPIQTAEPPLAQGPFRPRPRPPEPPAPPLSDDDAKLFGRLLPNIRSIVQERAQAEVATELQNAADALDHAQGGLVVEGQSQGALGSILAAAIVGFIKRWTTVIVMSVVGAAILGLLAKYWWIVLPCFTALVSAIAGPAGWAGAKWGKDK